MDLLLRLVIHPLSIALMLDDQFSTTEKASEMSKPPTFNCGTEFSILEKTQDPLIKAHLHDPRYSSFRQRRF